MRYLTVDNENLLINEFSISVNLLLLSNIQKLVFASKDNDTIFNLKSCISPIIDAHPLEQTLMVGPEFPYPLKDDLLLSYLLDNHRELNLIIAENPEKIAPTRLRSLRKKTYTTEKDIPQGFTVLNLQNIEENDIEYIHYWMFSERYKTIEMDWNNPYFYETMKKIVDILDISLIDSPSNLSKIVFYNKDEMTQEHYKSFLYFKEKLGNWKCYDRIKFIDYSSKTTFSLKYDF